MQPFSILLALGAGLGLFWAAWQVPEKRALATADAGLWVLFGAVVGGRVIHVAANWAYFQQALPEVLQIWQGGLAGIGALGGAMMALLLTGILTRYEPGELADALLPLLATVGGATWLGCWLEGCAYGALWNAWGGLPAPDESGATVSRLPLQLLGALLLVGWVAFLDRRRRQARPGMAAALGFLGISLELLALSFLRADPGFYWQGLRLDAWGALVLAFLSLAVFLFISLQHRRTARLPFTKRGDHATP